MPLGSITKLPVLIVSEPDGKASVTLKLCTEPNPPFVTVNFRVKSCSTFTIPGEFEKPVILNDAD